MCALFLLYDPLLTIPNNSRDPRSPLELGIHGSRPTSSRPRLENAIETVDYLLGTPFRMPLKDLFGLASLESDEDFVAVLQVSIDSVVSPMLPDQVLESAGLMVAEELGPKSRQYGF